MVFGVRGSAFVIYFTNDVIESYESPWVELPGIQSRRTTRRCMFTSATTQFSVKHDWS